MKSVSQHNFSMVPKADIPRSQFNRSHGYKTTFDSGWLIPFLVDEALPGDTFNLKASIFARLATPLKPIMDNLYLDTFFFAVPMRLVWDNWQKFNGEQENPGDSTDYLVPQMVSPAVTGYTHSSLSDYFGIPIGVPGLSHSSLWHRAYALIWNEWFRDQNLQDSIPINKGDGPDLPSAYSLVRRGKRHDYFTSCLPWPQKGPAVELPLGDSAPVTLTTPRVQTLFRRMSDNNVISGADLYTNATGGPIEAGATGNLGYIDPNGGWEVNLSDATAATINSLRQAFQIQKLYERDARGGTRYTEIIRSHFGVTSPDARLQRPEYLGGSSTPVNINPIAQTAPTESGTTPQGNLAAMGIVSSQGNRFVKSFTEHTLIIGLVSVRAELNYQQGLNRMFSRRTRWDFYWPALSHIGEQAVLLKEIYAQGSNQSAPYLDDSVFGYQERYAEYRYKPSTITGLLRSTAPTSLDVWHVAQDFGSPPTLNEDFIQEDPAVDRVIAVPSEPHFIMDSAINLKCARPMPTYSVPGLIDHF